MWGKIRVRFADKLKNGINLRKSENIVDVHVQVKTEFSQKLLCPSTRSRSQAWFSINLTAVKNRKFLYRKL